MDSIGYIAFAAVAVVAVILGIGISLMIRGGEANRKYSNKVMRLRVLAQFIAVLILVGLIYFAGRS